MAAGEVPEVEVNGGHPSGGEAGPDDDFADGLGIGDAIRFFLDAKRAGGR